MHQHITCINIWPLEINWNIITKKTKTKILYQNEYSSMFYTQLCEPYHEIAYVNYSNTLSGSVQEPRITMEEESKALKFEQGPD